MPSRAQKAKVAFLDINADASAQVVADMNAAGTSVHFEHCDLTDFAALQAPSSASGPRSGRSACSSTTRRTTSATRPRSVTPDYWDDRIAVNLKHQFFAAQAVLRT